MKINTLLLAAMLTLAGSLAASAHDLAAVDTAAPAWFTEPSAAAPQNTAAVAAFVAPAGNGTLMAASFAPFKPKVRYYWDSTYFYEESDGIPDRTRMPNLMVGITSWQQQVPLPTSYFGGTTNGTTNTGSLGYLQPNYWRIPLVPVAAASPISLTGNFLRGAVALGADGVAIFNPRNNNGQFSQAIGELDAYGGHCGLGDDYHYHIFPTHLTAVLGNDKPIAWGLDGYPVYGYVEPDGSAMQALDGDGGHNHGTWGYHYHARGTYNAGTSAWTPSSPYMMSAMHGTVVNFDSQIDPQPTGSGLRGSGTGGYTAVPVAGATITAFKNPVALTADGSGNLSENVGGVASDDNWLMRYTVSGTTYDLCWKLNRNVNPKTLTMTWRLPTISPTTLTYNNSGNRITAYPMAASSLVKLPDTGQTLNATATFGEDSDYTINAPSFTDNGTTITDNITGLIWQKTDNGESTWENAVTNAAGVTTGGFTDWRLPTPTEAMSILNHNNNPALNSTYFVNNASGTPDYFWTSDIYGASTTNVWCTNSGGGLGPKPKSETLSYSPPGAFRYHARYVRGTKANNGHNYLNNGDGTITDTDTNLMWTQVPSTSLSWTAALTYAEGLTTGGFSDWRLPNVKELQTLVDITRATATATTTTPCINRTLFPAATATAYWSSTSLKAATPTEAWLVEFGVNTTSTPSRNAQGIVSYEPYASTYPVFAVRSVPAGSISQGRATTVTTNLFPAGQRVSGVGTITATDNSTWTVPSATQFATAAKAPDLYNEYNGVTPANIAAAATTIANLPTTVIDADGEVVTGYIFCDNYFELYVNGVLVGVDPVPYTAFNSCVVKFKAKRPISYAVKLVDWEENLGLGTELNSGDPYHIGDGGFMASFSDGTVTNNQWKAQTFNIAPLDNPSQVVDLANGTHDSSAATTHTLTETAYALHYPVPSDWSSKTFSTAGWPSATTYTEAQVGINNIPAYTNFPAQFGSSGAQFIWSSNLLLDNEVIVRFTGPTAAATQIAVEQPSGTALTDGTSTVAYGSVNVGSTLSKTFTIRNNSTTTALSITGVTIDGTNAANYTVTTSPASSIAASGSSTMVVQFSAASAGAKTAALHIASSDTSAGAAFDINLTGTGGTTTPAITAIATTPASPTNLDSPWVNATIQAGSGATISTAQLTYNGGGTPTTTTVFTETMASAAVTPWTTATGTTINPWTVTTVAQANTFAQTTAANHGTGNVCGLVFDKGSVTATDSMIQTTNAINATGTSGYVEFWMFTVDMVSPNGWTFQTSTDGTTWTTRLSELTGLSHAYQLYHYDLTAAERVATLKMRFQFVGYNAVAPARPPKANLDDIKVVTTTGSAAVTLTMLDDGLRNDGAAGDGVYGAQIPAQTTGTTVSYTIAATDSNSATTTSSSASYTVGTATPVLAVIPATGLTSSGNAGGAFSPSSATYTLTNSGTGSLSWTASKNAAWLTLSSASGTLAAGTSTTVSATINTAANSLTAASYSDTITFTNSTNANGNTTRAVSLTVNATSAPAAPVLPTLATVTAGTTITLTWPAVSGATSYTLQIASSANFSTSLLASQTVTSPTAGFNSLTGGVTYYYRVIATNSIGSSTYSNTVFSTQDTSAPTVVITSPATGTSTATATIAVSGTSSGATSVKVNNVAATSANGFATWTATVPLGFGTNSITATATNGSGTSVTSAAVTVTLTAAQTYNPLIIPDTISGTTFNLSLNQKTKQFRTGAATTTYAYNGALMWGPTLIMNKSDAVQMNVTNNLIDTTTVHWHGFHIPAIMDGGPHQTVPAGTTWSPSWIVKNDAATYWYHPHLHGTTMEQLVKGAGGFIIVRDPIEALLALPRTYGVDDFPLALTSRRFLTSNQFSYDHAVDNYGDYMLVNGTLAPQVSLPKQYVRFRILNAEVARGYNLGFSDNRTFWVIANDQGLLNAPVAVTRMFLMVGERVEILVNLTNDALASSIELKAYNSGQVFGFPGQEGPVGGSPPTGNAGPVNGSLLNNTDFNILHINVAAATASPITALPATLVAQTYWTNANVTNTRTITLTGGNGGSEFTFNNITYTPTLFNHTIPLNAVEKWSISNNAGAIFGHSIHIHDIKFNIIARSGGTQVSSTGLAATYESGWKDTLYVPKGESVDVIAKYDDFASNTNPFMFHCHFLQHEDGGMMGQFVVVNSAVEDLAIASFTRTGANSDIALQFKSTVGTTYTLQYSADMTTSSWADIGSVTSNGAAAIFTETDATRLAQPKGYYRVKIPVIP